MNLWFNAREIRKRDQLLREAKLWCVFCGGHVRATTRDHCPPQALFKDRQAPVGFWFPACVDCNKGSSDEDVIVAMLAHMSPEVSPHAASKGLMHMALRQSPDAVHGMFDMSAVQARSVARRLGLSRLPGQTFQELIASTGVVAIPDAVHNAVARLAGKLTRAIYHLETGKIFPVDGGILFQWFTNAQLREHGQIAVLEAFAPLAGRPQPIRQGGQDLFDQFDCRYSVSNTGDLHVLQAVFGKVFGFVTVFSQRSGRVEGIAADLTAKTGNRGMHVIS